MGCYVPELQETGGHAVVLDFVVDDDVRLLLPLAPLGHTAATGAPCQRRGPLGTNGRLFHIGRGGAVVSMVEGCHRGRSGERKSSRVIFVGPCGYSE